MEVKVKDTCGRCGKESEKTLPLAEASKMEETLRIRTDAAADLTTKLLESLGSEHPDLVIALRGADGYKIKTLDNMCSSPDAKRNRGCTARVDYLIKEIFLLNPKPKTKPKTNKPADPPAGKPANGKAKGKK